MMNFVIIIIICNIIFFHLRTFVKLWELVDLRVFLPRPALPRGFSPLPRPTPQIFTLVPPRTRRKKAAPHIPDLNTSLAYIESWKQCNLLQIRH